MASNVVRLFKPSPKDAMLDDLENGLRKLLDEGPSRQTRPTLPPKADAWRAVARLLMVRELQAAEFGASYATPLWTALEGYAEGRITGAKLRAILRRVDLLASERPLRAGESA